MGWADKQKAGPAAQAAAETATQLDPNYFLGHMALGALRLRHNRHEDATLALRAAKNLNPSFPMTYNCLIACLTYGGRPFEALEQLEPLDRISPSDPYFGYYRAVRSVTYFTVDDLPAALDCARSSQALRPGWLVSQAVQIAAAQRSGLAAEAAEAAESFRHYHPGLTVQQLRDRFNFRSDRDFCKLAEALFDAGLE
jgi:tetratricopeptide (TPR) repeat protein